MTGWQASISQYKNKIYAVVQEMFRVLEHVLPSNRRTVDEYFFHPSFWRIELLLRSTRSINSKVLGDPDLAKITDIYTKAEEERLDNSLCDVAYELDTTATVQLITGEGRIERVGFFHRYPVFSYAKHTSLVRVPIDLSPPTPPLEGHHSWVQTCVGRRRALNSE